MSVSPTNLNTKPLVLRPPFTSETAVAKVRAAENAWNTQDPEKIALTYTENSWWRNRTQFIQGREQIKIFLKDKWKKELHYRLIKELWAYSENRISVKFQYEYQNASGKWFRAYGNENWEFDENGLMQRREASINDLEISELERKFVWPEGPRPESFPGLSHLGF